MSTRAKPPAYLRRVLALADRIPRGSVARVVVAHDNGCALLEHGGACDCEPTVTLISRRPSPQKRKARTP